MMKRTLKFHPSPVLRQKCLPVKKFGAGVLTILKDMAAIMLKEEGIGIAAPQVGLLARIIVVDWNGKALGLVNPKITHFSSEKEEKTEGCLSFPGVFIKKERSKSITVEFQDYTGKQQSLRAEDLVARCIQHEVEHLDGILFIDGVGGK